jgi:hypothetical protein
MLFENFYYLCTHKPATMQTNYAIYMLESMAGRRKNGRRGKERKPRSSGREGLKRNFHTGDWAPKGGEARAPYGSLAYRSGEARAPYGSLAFRSSGTKTPIGSLGAEWVRGASSHREFGVPGCRETNSLWELRCRMVLGRELPMGVRIPNRRDAQRHEMLW